MKYIEVAIHIEETYTDILIAELNEMGYDSFAETEEGVIAYMDASLFREEELEALQLKYKESFSFDYSFSPLEEKNWNEEWEKNFQPVCIGDSCIIRASFHNPEKTYTYDIVINPKMSFGTGHHETTAMMVEQMLEANLKGKTVMDAGSGTGILSIMASKIGAELVSAFDIEDWAYENSLENILQNHCSNIYVSIGSIKSVVLPIASYDVILANINKNVLLEELSEYSRFLKENGLLILSGFYEKDIADIDHEAGKCSLKQAVIKLRNNWASVVYEKTKNT